MKHHQEPSRSPISYLVNVARLPQRGMPVHFDADEEQRLALAEIHGLERIDSLVVDLLVAPWKRNGVKVTGNVDAAVVQSCVVTLEPVEDRVNEDIETVYLPEDSKLGREGFGMGGEIVLDADGPDSPEVFSGDIIDVGALAEEFFGLGINPYPHKPGAVAGYETDKTIAGEEEGSTFADKLRDALSKK